MAYKKRSERKHRSYGGKAGGPEHQYNAEGSPEAKEETAKSDGFRRGGHVKKERKHGGHVEGEHAKHTLAKRARGGHVEHRKHGGGVRGMSGGTPFSSARRTEQPENEKGSPGEQAPVEP
ncbi:MAG TPA: hypothetical protein VN692_17670 [Steroidobacteraceae bacterium]|nr:hypothetical protein [Steroidobacteraceae bacterium]